MRTALRGAKRLSTLMLLLFVVACGGSGQPGDTQAPETPQNFSARASDGQVVLSWDANAEEDLAGYSVYQGNAAASLEAVASTDKTVTSYTVSGLQNGRTYTFALTAKDAAGNESAQTAAQSATPVAAVIPDTTHVTDEATKQNLSAFESDGTLRFSAETPLLADLEPGDVLASEPVAGVAPSGFLRKITAKRSEGGGVVLETEQAQLTDAVTRAQGSFSAQLKPDGAAQQSALPGVVEAQAAGFDFSYNFNEVLLDADPLDITLSGTFSFNATLDLVVDIDWDGILPPEPFVDVFEVSVLLEEQVDTTLSAVGDYSFKDETTLAVIDVATQTFFIGPVPVVIDVDLEIFVGAYGQVGGRMVATAMQNASLDVGARYTNAKGWQDIWTPSASSDVPRPGLEGSASARAYTGARLAIGLYSAPNGAGTVTARLFVEGDAAFPRDPTWCVYGGYNASYGYRVQLPVIGELAFYDKVFTEKRDLIKCAENLPPIIDITSPKDGANFLEAEAIDLAVDALDPEGLPVTVTWLDEGGTPLNAANANTLCPGTHTLTARVSDNRGQTAEDKVTVSVRNRAPELTILNPPGSVGEDEPFSLYVGEGQPFSLYAKVTDKTCADPEGLTTDGRRLVAWTVEDGVDGVGTGHGTLISAQGAKTVTATYQDNGATPLTASDKVTVNVNAPDPAGYAPAVTITSPANGKLFTAVDNEYDGTYYNIELSGGAFPTATDFTWSYRLKGESQWQPLGAGSTLEASIANPGFSGDGGGRATFEFRLQATNGGRTGSSDKYGTFELNFDFPGG